MTVHSNGVSYFIETFGCQMNERDSQTIEGLLAAQGLTKASTVYEADVVVVNTCAVRQSAEAKVWSRLGYIAASAKNRKPPVIVLAGCMAQLPETIERVRKRVPYVKVLTGPGQIHRLPELIKQALNDDTELLTSVSPGRSEAKRTESTQMLPEGLPRIKVQGVSAYVTIMYGCDNFCSYCIVPFVRGPQVSREADHIIDEVEDLVSQGYSEVTLLGQNVNAYGFDLDEQQGFSALLEELDKIHGLKRIRYFTSHPRDFSKQMVDTIKTSKHICEHFHLPVQAGSNRILKQMNRGYPKEGYLKLLDYIRSEVPGAAITTDIIVGFPGETDAEFQETLDLVETARFDGAFTFIYSPRSGTSAARIKNQVQRKIKSKRLQELVNVQNDITKSINESLIGSVQEILVEGKDIKNPQFCRGRTRTNKLVVCTDGDLKQGDLANVRIVEAGTWYLKGPRCLD